VQIGGFLDLKMTKTSHKPNTDPNPNTNLYTNPNTKQTLIVILILSP